ncbi:MAG: 30S ribosomal protein S18 [Parcubacteria group bacterium]|nr:30S ribosomal protein S18 [Parcubacteria group bacterium]
MAYNKPVYRKRNKALETKQCYFCTNDVDVVDFKETAILRNFLTHQYKIAPRKRTGTCSRHQRRVANSIKRARIAALLPFTQHQR